MTQSNYNDHYLSGNELLFVKSAARRTNRISGKTFYTFEARMPFGEQRSTNLENYVIVNGVFSENAWQQLGAYRQMLLDNAGSKQTVLQMIARTPRLDRPAAFVVKNGENQGAAVPTLGLRVNHIVRLRPVVDKETHEWRDVEDKANAA